MKNKTSLSILFNPFTRIAGIQSLIIGSVIVTLTALIGYHNGVIFDGVIDIHFASVKLSTALLVKLISVVTLISIMYFSGRVFSASSIRFIDVAGTLLLARAPYILVALVTLFPIIGNTLQKLTDTILSASVTNIDISDWIIIVTVILVFTISSIWSIILSYNAFKISCNIQGIKNGIVFTVSFLLAEIISKAFIIMLISNSLGMGATANIDNDIHNNNDSIIQIATETTWLIKNEEYGKATVHFDEKMKEALGEIQLKQTMETIQSQFGKITSIGDNIDVVPQNNYRIVSIPVHCEKRTINFNFTFSEQNQIIGFYM